MPTISCDLCGEENQFPPKLTVVPEDELDDASWEFQVEPDEETLSVTSVLCPDCKNKKNDD